MILGLLVNVVLFLGIAVLGGVLSALHMIDNGSALATKRYGPWVNWAAAGRMEADPYTRAHVARVGWLPISTAFAMTYVARTDSDGSGLHSSCEYSVEGPAIEATWWSLAVYDDRGRAIQNPSERYAFNAATAVRDADGRVTVSIARSARPGNWLPVGGAGSLTLMLSVQDQKWSQQALAGAALPLPIVRKVACR